MANPQDKPVPTPLRHRLKGWRFRFLPLIVWVAVLGACIILLKHQTRTIDAVGYVEVRDITVAPLGDGIIQGVSVELFDTVESGQVVALMDDTLIKGELEVAESELVRLRADLKAQQNRIQLESHTLKAKELDELRNYRLNEEEARLNYLDRIVEYESDKVTFERLGVMAENQKQLMEQNAGSQATYDDVRLRQESLRVKIKESEGSIAQSAVNLEQIEKRNTERLALKPLVEQDQLLQPFLEGVKVQEARIRDLVERHKQLVLKSPIAGKVSQILQRAGDTVLAGTPVLTLTNPRSNRVIAYVDEREVKIVKIGTGVELYSRHLPRESIKGRVIKVSPKLEELPLHLRRNPILPQWGLAVLVGDLPYDIFYSGETLDLRFLTSN